MKKKSLNEISDKELLDLLDNFEDLNSEDTEISFDSSVISFIQTFNLSPGKDRIIKKQLYNLYKIWNKGLFKLTPRAFTNEMSNYIEHKGNFFLVNKDIFTIASFIQKEQQKHKINKVKSKYWLKHFISFLNDTQIEEGTYYIELEILHFLYLQWRRKNNKNTTLSRKQFIKILDLYFDVKAISHGDSLWVGVNEQIKNLISKKEVDRWRKTRAKDKKRFYYPKEEWKTFALYWEEKKKE